MRGYTVSFRLDQFRSGALLKLGIISNLGFWIPVGLLLGILGMMGFDVVSFNDSYIHGVGAIITGLIFGALFALVGSMIFVIGGVFARPFARRARNLRIELQEDSAKIPDDGNLTT